MVFPNQENFHIPAKKYRPMVRWWWPGLEVDEDELRREVRDLDEAGFGGAELQPFMIGTPYKILRKDEERAKRHHRFMQPYHYEMIAAVMDEAKQRGLFIDVTQNSAWPTGGAHIPIEESFQTLLFETSVVKGGGQRTLKIPKLKKPSLYKFLDRLAKIAPAYRLLRYIPDDKKIVKVIAGKLKSKKGKIIYKKVKKVATLEFDSMTDLTPLMGQESTFLWDVPDGKWQIFFCFEGSAGSLPVSDTRNKPWVDAHVVDHLSKDAAINHLEAFLGKGKEYFGEHYGTTFQAFFTDSFELITPMHWRKDFLTEFEKRRGYDLTPYLPVAYVPLRDIGYWWRGHEVGKPCFDFEGDIGERIRYDFERTVSDLFVQEFIQPLQEWAEKNDLKSRVQGYGIRVDNLEMLGYSGIPETEQLYAGGMLHFLKLGGAAGTLYNRPKITSESMVWNGRSYMTTPLKWRVAADRLFESGVNGMIYHGFPYRHQSFPYPGFFPFGAGFSGDFSRDSEFWSHFPTMNQYVTRMQYLMQESKTVVKIGIFMGTFDIPSSTKKEDEELFRGYLNEEDAPVERDGLNKLIVSDKEQVGERKYIAEMAALGDILIAHGYYYFNINSDRLLKATVEGKKVVIGEAEFEALIFFKETHLPIIIMDKLDSIANQGIPIIFVDCLPTRQKGFKDWKENDRKVASTCAKICGDRNKVNAEGVPALLRSHGVMPQIEFSDVSSDIGFIQKENRSTGEPLIMMRNRSKHIKSVSFAFNTGGLIPYQLDAMKGQYFKISFTALSERKVELSLRLEAYQSVVIGFGPSQQIANLPDRPPAIDYDQGKEILKLDDWSISLSKREVDGSATPIEQKCGTPDDWRNDEVLKECSGPAEYKTQFTLSPEIFNKMKRYTLNFSRVCDIATVTLNGTKHAPLLLPPWYVDITEALKSDANDLTVKVETTYRNLLVGYGNSGSKDYKPYKKKGLMPSGLIGKISILQF